MRCCYDNIRNVYVEGEALDIIEELPVERKERSNGIDILCIRFLREVNVKQLKRVIKLLDQFGLVPLERDGIFCDDCDIDELIRGFSSYDKDTVDIYTFCFYNEGMKGGIMDQ